MQMLPQIHVLCEQINADGVLKYSLDGNTIFALIDALGVGWPAWAAVLGVEAADPAAHDAYLRHMLKWLDNIYQWKVPGQTDPNEPKAEAIQDHVFGLFVAMNRQFRIQ